MKEEIEKEELDLHAEALKILERDNNDYSRGIIRQMVRQAYDLQALRVQTGNRIISALYRGIFLPRIKARNLPEKELRKSENKAEKLSTKLLEKIEVIYERNRTGEGFFFNASQIVTDLGNSEDEDIKENIPLILKQNRFLQNFTFLIIREKILFKDIEKELSRFPIYINVLKKVMGIGPALAGVIISELDPSKADYVSSFWKYAGVDVAEDGRGRGRYDEHLIVKQYVDKNGEDKERNGITFNPFLKTKMLGVLGPSFLKQGDRCAYTHLYYDYHNRLDNNPIHAEKTKDHKYKMSIRYMVKIFLQDLWLVWRKMEGLPVTEPYHVRKLNMTKHASNL